MKLLHTWTISLSLCLLSAVLASGQEVPLDHVQPEIASLEPASMTMGRSFVLTVTGSHFVDPVDAELVAPDGTRITLQVQQITLTKLTLAVPILSIPGSYRLNITTADGTVSSEEGHLKARYPLPEVIGLNPQIISKGNLGRVLSISGHNFSPQARVSLWNVAAPEQGPFFLQLSDSHETLLKGTVAVELPLGDYEVLVSNSSEDTAVSAGILHVSEVIQPIKPIVPRPTPAPKPKVASESLGSHLSLEEGIFATLPVGDWNQVYSWALLSPQVSVDWHLTSLRKSNTTNTFDLSGGFAIGLDNFSSPPDTALVKSSLLVVRPSLHLSTAWVATFGRVEATFGGGLAYLHLSVPTSGSSTVQVAESLDPLCETTLKGVFSLGATWGLVASCGFWTTFSTHSFQGVVAGISIEIVP